MMELTDFQGQYEHLTDEELLEVAVDSPDLVPKAAAALKAEIRKRGVRPSEPTRWLRQPGSSEQVKSLQDYEEYRRLCRKRQFMNRYWYVLAMGPFLLGLLLGRRAFENSAFLILLTVAWALLVVGYG